MPAGFRRHFVGKTLRNVCFVTLLSLKKRFVAMLVITRTFSIWISQTVYFTSEHIRLFTF